MVSTLLVAPEVRPPLVTGFQVVPPSGERCHANVKGALPSTWTARLRVWQTRKACAAGRSPPVMISGGPLRTVTAAGVVVTEPAVLCATNWYCALRTAELTVRVNEGVVEPATLPAESVRLFQVPPPSVDICHW